MDGRTITYQYDGSGRPLKTIYSNGETWDNTGGLIYKNNSPSQIATTEGRYLFKSSEYEYDYKDHLGNTRLSFKEVNGKLIKTAETAFDPWGLEIAGIGQKNNPANRWEMQGHEKEMTFSLNRIMFGARTYNPTIGRFDGVDPLVEVMNNWSSYAFCYDNPINFIDNDGMIPLPQIIKFSKKGRGVSTNSWNPWHKKMRSHKGVDLQTGGKQGLSVFSAAEGTIERIGWDGEGWGRYVIVRHSNGYFSLYAHLKKKGVLGKLGDNVTNGQEIALSGNTGGSSGPHLHLEFRRAKDTNGSFRNASILNPYDIEDLQDLVDGKESETPKSNFNLLKPEDMSFNNNNLFKLSIPKFSQFSNFENSLDLFNIQIIGRFNQINEEKLKESRSGMVPGAPPNN